MNAGWANFDLRERLSSASNAQPLVQEFGNDHSRRRRRRLFGSHGVLELLDAGEYERRSATLSDAIGGKREIDGGGNVLDAQSYVFKEILKDGSEVTVRAARTDDGARIRRAFLTLDRVTIHSRFFGFKKEVSDAELRHITHMDFDRDVSLLVTAPTGDDERVIGGASYFSTDADPPERSAEVAFTVVKGYHGLGVAGMLMRRLAGIARARGLSRLEADVLESNKGMMSVFNASSLPMTTRREGNVIHVTMSLRTG